MPLKSMNVSTKEIPPLPFAGTRLCAKWRSGTRQPDGTSLRMPPSDSTGKGCQVSRNRRWSVQLRMALTKAAIYEATTSILIEGGLDALNMDQVAEAADISKGTIYRYFKSKLELLRFVHEQSVQSLSSPVDDLINSPLASADKLASLLKAWCSGAARDLRVLATCAGSKPLQATLDSANQGGHAYLVAQVARIFAQGIKSGCFRPAEPTYLAEVFVDASVSMIASQLFAESCDDFGSRLSVFLDAFLHGVKS